MNEPSKPYSEACEQNKRPILEVLEPCLAQADSVLEVGSGTGQHAVYFAARMPHLRWQTSDRVEHHAGIRLWLDEAGLDNLVAPLDLDVTGEWPQSTFDAVFSANTAHIMSLPEVEAMFRGVATVLARGGQFALYGPFNYGGRYTSASNARFDQWLKTRDPESGIKSFEALAALAEDNGMGLTNDYTMPVNNRVLLWQRV